MKAIRLLLFFAMTCAGCKSGQSDGQKAKVDEGLDRLQKNEADILSRRSEMAQERDKIRADREALEHKRSEILAKGGDVHQVDEEERQLSDREKALLSQQDKIEGEMRSLLTQYKTMTSSIGATNDVAQREVGMAGREKDVGQRERELARREENLAKREATLAQREKETCSGQGGVTTIVREVPVDTSGVTYSRRDVEPVLRKARRKMSERGILPSDLPSSVQGLEKEATKAMADGDYGRAKLAATQLYESIKEHKIGRSFVSAKIKRLNDSIRGKTLAADTRERVDKLFRDATGDYGDGNFSAANSKLNKIDAMIN